MRLLALLLVALSPVLPAHAEFRDLLDAARLGASERVEMLLAEGTDPNPPSYHNGYSPLQFAAGNGDAAMTWLLLANGAAPDYRDHNGDRALLWAAERGQAETVRLLLAAKSPADSDDDPYGHTPLMKAARNGHAEVVQLLLAARADIARRGQGGDTALHFSVQAGSAEITGLLLKAGANPNVFDTILFETPLHEAALRGQLDVVTVLLGAGAGTEPRDKEGRTPLFVAARQGNHDVVAALVEAHAAIDARDLAGHTPILAALGGAGDADGRQRVATLLARYTADVDRAFAMAVGSAHASVVSELLARGADANALDADGRPALAHAAAGPGPAVLEMLLARGADVARHGGEALLAAAAAGRVESARILLARGVAVDMRAETGGATPLMLAARAGEVEMVRLLLASGADASLVDVTALDADAHMRRSQSVLAGHIERREASRAYKPTDTLRLDLEALRGRHEEIRKLLAESRGM